MLSGMVPVTSNNVTRTDPIEAGPFATVMVAGYGAPAPPKVVQMLPVERYALAVSMMLSTAVLGEPTPAPVKVSVTVWVGSVSVSLHSWTFTVLDVSPALNVTACATVM